MFFIMVTLIKIESRLWNRDDRNNTDYEFKVELIWCSSLKTSQNIQVLTFSFYLHKM